MNSTSACRGKLDPTEQRDSIELKVPANVRMLIGVKSFIFKSENPSAYDGGQSRQERLNRRMTIALSENNKELKAELLTTLFFIIQFEPQFSKIQLCV